MTPSIDKTLHQFLTVTGLDLIYTFVVSRAFMAGAVRKAGDADSSRATGLTSGLQGVRESPP